MPHHTYHCVCSQLVLCTPYNLSTLPRRAEPALDHALILPLRAIHPGKENAAPDSEQMVPEKAQDSGLERRSYGASTFLQTVLDRKPVVVRREDGFEKRWVRRCARCRTSVAYELRSETGEDDWAHDSGPKVAYVLDGALVGTEVLDQGQTIETK